MRKLLTFLFACICIIGSAQDFYDMSTIQTIKVYFSNDDWDASMDAAELDDDIDYIMADSIVINGTKLDSVGAKFKGNSSYSATQVKNPWHIELDTYKDQDYEGYSDIKLANVYNDPSFLRDVLGYQIIRQYMDAPLANYANLYVNDVLIGLYSNTEAISKTFLKDRFGSKSNTFFNCSPPDGADPTGDDFPTLENLGTDSALYYESYEIKSDYGWQELIDLTDTLANNIDDIENILDVDKALWMLSFDNAIVNLDSYMGLFSQNYYLYRDDYGRFLSVVWDLNESFGVFNQTGLGTLSTSTEKQEMDYLLHSTDDTRPLIKNLLEVDRYKKMYLAHMKTMLEENFENESYKTTATTLQAVIDASVQADNNKFFTYDQFLTGLEEDDSSTTTTTSGPPSGGPGSTTTSTITIAELMDARSSYLLALDDFTNTQPTITNISLSESSPEIGESIYITADVTDETDVFLNYRSVDEAPFTMLQMYDDGLHGDGSASDGTYGVEITNLEALTQYFFYAENSNAGKFSPERAAFEFYSFESTTGTTTSDLVINELLASNTTTATDQNGEYDDWIELYNNSSSAIDLGGYYLTDDSNDLTQWEIPTGTSIAANSYLIIWADNDTEQTGLHANFKLSASGETITLSDASGTMVDQVTYTTQTEDVSYGRYANGTGSFQTMTPSYSSENLCTTAISENEKETFELNIYPNPTNGPLYISSEETITKLSIYSTSGKKIFSMAPNAKNIDYNLSYLTRGIYFIKVITEGGKSQVEKLILY